MAGEDVVWSGAFEAEVAMAENTKIQWTEATWNPIRARDLGPVGTGPGVGWHCEIIKPGCENCYAQSLNRFRGTHRPYLRAERSKVHIYLHEETLTQPLRWERPCRIFVCSMTDLFGEWVTHDMIQRVIAVMEAAPQHTYQILTKRAERMRASALDEFSRYGDLPPNWWMGVSVEDQRRADERIPVLLETPAAVRWVSAEPCLEDIDIQRYLRRMVVGPADELTDHMIENGWSFPGGQGDHPGINWLVCGGESGWKNAVRPFHIEWARSIIQQCRAAGVPVFMKQLGSDPRDHAGIVWSCADHKGGDPEEWPEDLRVREYPG